jgi:hypothetical protein
MEQHRHTGQREGKKYLLEHRIDICLRDDGEIESATFLHGPNHQRISAIGRRCSGFFSEAFFKWIGNGFILVQD